MNSFLSKALSLPRAFLALTTVKKIFVILIILAVGWFVYGKFLKPKSREQYQTSSVTKGTLVVSAAESGTVLVANRISISTQTSGTINHVYVKNGDSVTTGEKIADLTLDTDGITRQAQAYSSLLSAQNNLNSATAKINSLQSTLFKANQAFLNDRGINNPTDQDKADPKYIEENAEWLQAEADYKNQTNSIAQAQAGLNSATLAYNAVSSSITAPTDGVISDIIIAPGMVITNSQSSTSNNISSQVVASIKHSGTPIISVSLSEIDVTKVKPGQKATITLDSLPDKTFTGKVLGIDTTGIVSSGVTSYPATIALDTSEDSIFPNMSASANIILNIKDNILLVPSGTVQTVGGQTTVRILKNGRIQNIDVEVGESSDTETEIKSGLKEGDTVVTGTVSSGQASSSTSSSPFSRSIFGGFGGGANVRVGGGIGGNRTGGGTSGR